MAGNQTFLKGNMRPAAWNSNLPDWAPNEGSVPESSIFTENIHDRLMVVYGKPSGLVEGERNPLFSGMGVNGEGDVQAKFRCKSILLQNCTGLQLQEVVLSNAPSMMKTRGLLEGEDLCGDMISDDMVTLYRMDFREMNTISFQILGLTSPIQVDLRNFLHHFGDGSGKQIAYHSLTELFQLISRGIEHFLEERGYTSVTVAVFADPANNGDVRIFWSSSLGTGRLAIDLNAEASNFFTQAFNFFVLSSGVRTDTYNGVDGESFSVTPKSILSRSFQNASPFMTIHSNEITQFRKFDSISFTEGGSLMGVLNCVPPSDASFVVGIPAANPGTNNLYRWSIQDGSLIAPKINFSKDQLLTEFEVALWGGALSYFNAQFVGFDKVEAAQVSLVLVFRLW